jgi:hypothetical protein
MKKNSIVFLLVILIVVISSCRKEAQRIDCNPFSNQSDLIWFSGIIGDTFTFKNQEDSTLTFTVVDKYILHNLSYAVGSGCNCHDIWGMMLAGGGDTISMHSHYAYNQYESIRYDNIFIKMNGVITPFLREHRSELPSFQVNNVSFTKVLRYHQQIYQDVNRLSRVYVAPDTGIIQIEALNGDIWVNTELDRSLRTDFESFEYYAQDCP